MIGNGDLEICVQEMRPALIKITKQQMLHLADTVTLELIVSGVSLTSPEHSAQKFGY